jgi:simple sugar transport system permease protein/ribose transport system permease protein
MSLRIKIFLLDNVIWALVIGFFLLNAIVTPSFFTWQNSTNILYHSSIMSMLVLGQGIVIVVKALDLSIESTLAFAPGVAMLICTQWLPFDLPSIVAIVLTLIVGALVGLFNGFFIAKVGMNPFIETMSTMIIMRGLVLFLVPFSIFPLAEVYKFAGQARIPGDIPVAVLLMLLVYAVFQFIFGYTAFGRRLIATGGNRQAAFIAGINTDRMIIAAFVIAGLLAAFAGLLTAGRQGSISPSMGLNMVLLSFAGAILGGASLDGGKGAPIGFLGGALLLGMFSNALNLRGVEVNLVYAMEGLLIFAAILLDRVREAVRARVLRQEQVARFESATTGATTKA